MKTRHVPTRQNAPLTPIRPKRRTAKIAALATMIAAASFSTALAQTNGTWSNLAGGSWGTTTNWTGGTIAGGIGATANFSTLNITANATVTLDGSRTVGTIIFQDATTASNDWFLAPGTGGALTLDVASGSASIQVLNRTATVNVAIAGNDTIAATGAGTLVLGAANAFTGQFTIGNGLTVNAGNATALGITGVGAETIVLPGGTLNVNAQNLGVGEEVRIAGTGVGSVGALINNGAAQLNALSTVVLTNHATIGGSGRFDIRNGTPLLDLAGFRLTKIAGNQFSVVGGSITSGNIDINAGTFSIEATANVSGNGTISANPGGILGFWTNNGIFTRNIVLNGGALRELGSDNPATTISSNISLTGSSAINIAPGTTGMTNLNLNGNITETGGSFGLTKGEAGKVTLNGSQNFTGLFAINAGTVVLGADSTLATRQIAIADGAVFDASARGGYTLGAGGSLVVGRAFGATDVLGNFTANAGSTISVGANFASRTATFLNNLSLDKTNLNLDLDTAGNDNFVVAGDLSATGVNAITLRPSSDLGFSAGSVVLFSYGGSLNATPANFSIVNAGNFRQTFAIDTTTIPGQVLLDVTGTAGTSTWVGGLANNIWDINTTNNWNNGGPDKYSDTDAVTFNDTGSNSPAVNIATAVTPGVLTVDNSLKDYVFSGKGRITGPAGINKMGTGKLTLTSDTHDFSGLVNVSGGGTISGGVLSNNGVAGSFGTGTINLDDGTLEYTGGTATSNRTITLSFGNGSIRVAEPQVALTLSTALGGSGGLFKTGPGILSLSANVGFAGDITISDGVLRATTNTALGSKTINVSAGATFDPNGQTGAGSRPVLNIVGSGVPGAAAIWNFGAAQTNNPLYGTINLVGDAVFGTPVRYDLTGGTGGVNFNADVYSLQKVGTGETWWSPNAGAVINDLIVRHGRFGVQQSNNLASHFSITSSAIYVLPAGELATFGEATTNTKAVVLSGGTLASTGGATATGQFWRGGVTLNANSFFDNRGTAVANQITIDNVDPAVGSLVLGGSTLEKLGSSGLLILANTAASTTGSGAGTLRIYNGQVTLQSGFIMDGAGQVRIQNFGQLNLNNNGTAPILTKEVRLDTGTLNNAAGNNSAGAIVIGAHGRIFNSAAGSTLSLGNITVPAQKGIQFGTTGGIALTTINGAAPVVGAGNRLGVDYTAGTSPAATGFATWNGSVVGLLPTTATNPTAPTAADDSIYTAATTLAGSATTNTLISGADVVIPNGALLTIASGGVVMRGADHSINTPANGTGRLTTGAADGRLVINAPEPIDTRGALHIRAQMVDTPLPGGGFRPMSVHKHGPGQATQWGTDNGGNMLNNLYSGGTVINSSRITPNGTLALGTARVTINDGGQLALFNETGAAGQASFIHNNMDVTGRGVGENGGYFGAIRMGANVNVSGNITVSDITRIHNQNGQGAISGRLLGGSTIQHTGNNLTWLTNPASTFSGINEFGFRDQTGQISVLVTKLANGGQPSSIGSSSSAAANLVFHVNPILRYVGIGDSTDRLFTLAGGFNLNGAPGAIIDGSGYGAINFTNTGAIAFGPGSYRQLTLRASTLSTGGNVVGGNLPLNVFAPNLGDPTDHGFGQLVKDGPGRWVITANHTYSGTTTVNDGILVLGNGGTTGMFGNGAGGLGPNTVTIANSAAVHLNRSDSYTIPNTVTSSNANGNTEIVQLGAGTVSLAGPNDNSSTRVRVENGVIELAKASSPAVHSAALLATVGVGGRLRLAGTGSDQLFDGATNGIWTTVQMNGGIFDMNGRDEAVYRVEGSGTITNTAAGTTSTLTVGGGLNGTGNGASRLGGGLAAAINNGAGVMALTKNGTGTIALTGVNGYSGATTINGGVLSIGNGGATGTLGSAAVTVATGAVLAVNRSNAYTVINAITGGGGLTQQGTGTTTVNTPLGYTGQTTVNAGVLNVNLGASNDVLPTVGRLALNGGIARFTGGAGGASAQTIGELQVAGGDVTVDGTAGLTTLNLSGTLLRPAGGTVNFATIGASVINSTVANTNGILGTGKAAYATINGTDWATGNGAAIVPLAPAGYTADTYAVGTHTDVVAVGAVPGGSVTSTIRLNTPVTPALALAGALVVDQGGILVTPTMSAAGTAITGGTLTGTAATGSEIVVHQHTTAGLTSATQISSSIIDNGANLTGLTKAGPGILALTGANTYAGDTHVNQGILAVGAFGTAGTLGTGPVYNDAILAFARTDTLVVNNPIGGNGQVVQIGGGTVRLNAPNTFSGGLLISAGTVTSDRGFGGSSANPTNTLFGLGGTTTDSLANADPANGAGLGAITLGDSNTGSANIAFLSDFGADFANPIIVTSNGTGTASIGSNSGAVSGTNPAMFTGPITLNRATIFQGSNADRTTYLGQISGNPGTVTIAGNRTTWENDNTFTGNIVINASATLQIGTGAFSAPRDQVPDTADITLNASAFFTLNGDSETINTLNSSATNSQVQSAAGGGQSLRILNGGTFNGIFNGGNNNGMTIEVAGGTMTFGGTADNATGHILVTGGTAVLGKTSATGVHANAVDLTINAGGTALIGGTFTGALPNYGTGVTLPGNFRDQIFDGANGASSTVVINGGTLNLGGFSEGIGRLDGNGGIVTNNVAATTSTLFVGTANSSNLFTAGFYGNVQDGAGTVALGKVGSGIAIFAGNLSHTGGTSIYAGALQIGNGGTTGTISGNVAFINASNTSFIVNRSGTADIPANISGGGAVILNGDGLVKFTGNNTYTGTSTINDGVLQIGNGGTTGTLGTGNVTLYTTLSFDRSNTLIASNAISGPGTVDQDGTGTTTLNGALNFPEANVNDGRLNLDSSLANATINDNNGILVLNANATNSTVNVDDTAYFTVSQTLAALNIGGAGTVILGAAPPSPVPAGVDDDLLLEPEGPAAEFAAGEGVQAVPEPASWSLLMLGALGLLGRRRRAGRN